MQIITGCIAQNPLKQIHEKENAPSPFLLCGEAPVCTLRQGFFYSFNEIGEDLQR